MRETAAYCLLVGLAVSMGGCSDSESAPHASLAVTNAYLESVVRDLLGGDAAVLCLTQPGMCPGHFDIRPGQVSELRGCRLLLRLDFQKGLDGRLAPLVQNGLVIGEVRPAGGLCRPTTYVDACRQTAEVLVRSGLLAPGVADRRLAAAAERMTSLAQWARGEMERSGSCGLCVVASEHQRDFCEWLGLKVVATFRGADVAGVREVDAAVRAGAEADVSLVVANRPEGRRLADALAGRLGVDVVVLDNFPDSGSGELHFDALVKANVDRLSAAEARWRR